MKTVLEARAVTKYFHDPVKFTALNNISFTVSTGEFLAITGKSGCGKSTLLYILSTMDTDYEGELFIDGQSMTQMNGHQLSHIRNEKIGFVFQFHYLLPEFTVLKNVMLPAVKLAKLELPEIEAKAIGLLKRLGIENQASKAAHQLSGGQKQRVAIARSLINDPLILMGDEPTGNLDSKNSAVVFDIFKEIAVEQKQTILVVTHDEDFARNTDRIIVMDDGKIIS
ncbi:MAG TPA: ABC transporter ATP-binding protein [Bacteroidia bacterium]|nr:ABC transporter ATP-binding protein [Bacteroidia bacterium]